MTTEQMKVKQWLNRAFYAEKKVKALEQCVEQCKQRIQSVSVCYEGNDKGKTDTAENGTENAIFKLLAFQGKLENQIKELADVSDEILDVILQLQDDDLETVLIYRYILFYTIEQTAELMNYSPVTVKRKQNRAIEKMIPFDLV